MSPMDTKDEGYTERQMLLDLALVVLRLAEINGPFPKDENGNGRSMPAHVWRAAEDAVDRLSKAVLP